MKFIYKQDNKGRYYISTSNNGNIHNIIPLILKIPKDKYEEFLRENGGRLELDGKMYFRDKQKIKDVVDELNVMRRLSK